MSIYTRTGDKGTTSLVDGMRVSKADARLEAYGTIDELIANIAYLKDCYLSQNEQLDIIVERLMCAAGLVACLEPDKFDKFPRIRDIDVQQLERWIDEILAVVPQIRNFTLPGGAAAVSYAHVCRTVCRRAERASIRCNNTDAQYPVDEMVLMYLNRLSDYLYALSRYLHFVQEVPEKLWVPVSGK